MFWEKVCPSCANEFTTLLPQAACYQRGQSDFVFPLALAIPSSGRTGRSPWKIGNSGQLLLAHELPRGDNLNWKGDCCAPLPTFWFHS
jgi:hypothetical protein